MKIRDTGVNCLLKSMRQSRGLTQNQLAEWIGVKRQAIYDMESGRYLPNTALALKLARHLGCRVEDLFTETPSKELLPVSVIEKPGRQCPRVAVARIRERLVAYPLEGRHSLNDGLRAADGFLEGGSSRVRLLCHEEEVDKTVFIMGCDPAFAILREHVRHSTPEARIYCRFASSHRALEALREGHAHMAGTHLHNTGSGESNALAARSKLTGSNAMLIGFSMFEEGLLVAPGNPFAVRDIADLTKDKLRFVNREQGAALRVLLDDNLNRLAIPSNAITGYADEVSNHYEGAQMVANQYADAVLGLRVVANSFGLDFVPIKVVRCDLVVPRDLMEHHAVKIILDTLQTRMLRQELDSLPGYDSSVTGEIISEF
jgi:molybdate-binding protein/DNA-binding XRE family transcriptional regulator